MSEDSGVTGEENWQGNAAGLPVAKGDAPFGQVVGREFHGDAVAGKHADAVAAQTAGEVREHDTLMFQLDAEQTARKLLQDNSGDFDIVFFTHSTFLYQSRAPLRPGKPAIRDEGRPVCRALSPEISDQALA